MIDTVNRFVPQLHSYRPANRERGGEGGVERGGLGEAEQGRDGSGREEERERQISQAALG